LLPLNVHALLLLITGIIVGLEGLLRALVGAAALVLSSFEVDKANAYHDQPIKIIVTFPPDMAPLAELGLSEFESVGRSGAPASEGL